MKSEDYFLISLALFVASVIITVFGLYARAQGFVYVGQLVYEGAVIGQIEFSLWIIAVPIVVFSFSGCLGFIVAGVIKGTREQKH